MPQLKGARLPGKDGEQEVFDATGSFDADVCPRCGSNATITYHYEEGFEELECRACGYVSDAEELAALQRFESELLEDSVDQGSPIPNNGKRIRA